MPSPVIVLVPGAFGTPAGYDKLLPYLKEAGFSTYPGPYPSCNASDPATATAPKDIASFSDDILRPLIEQEQKDIVIIAHSYGGIVAGAAAKDLDKPTRQAQNLTGGVIGLIYVAGNIALEGESLLDAVGGAYPPFIKVGKPSTGFALIEPAMDILYNDCDRALTADLESQMKPHAHLAFETKATAPAWADKAFDGKRAYVRTLDDCCNPSFVQDAWLEKSKVKWDVVDLKAGHMPFVSQPDVLAGHIVKLIKGFTAV